MKLMALIILALLLACSSPMEPEVYTDVCIDTFGPRGGTTITLKPGESLPDSILPAPLIILVDSTM
jgi:hypothetical protein